MNRPVHFWHFHPKVPLMFDRSTRFGSLYIDWRYREIESPRQHVTATSSHPRHLLDHRLNRGKAGIANKENVDEC